MIWLKFCKQGQTFHFPQINSQVHLQVVGPIIALRRVLKFALAPNWLWVSQSMTVYTWESYSAQPWEMCFAQGWDRNKFYSDLIFCVFFTGLVPKLPQIHNHYYKFQILFPNLIPHLSCRHGVYDKRQASVFPLRERAFY